MITWPANRHCRIIKPITRPTPAAALADDEEGIMAEIMTPGNPRWEEFAERLRELDECDLVDGEGFEFTEVILRKMGSVDIPATLEYFLDRGRRCDFEILLNIQPYD